VCIIFIIVLILKWITAAIKGSLFIFLAVFLERSRWSLWKDIRTKSWMQWNMCCTFTWYLLQLFM